MRWLRRAPARRNDAPSALWITFLLAAGSLLAVALLVQTIVNYRFVSTSLVRQQARRSAEDSVRSVERAIRQTRPLDAEGLRATLDEIRNDSSDQVASLAVLQGDGVVIAAAGPVPGNSAVEDPRRTAADRDIPLKPERRNGRDVLVGVFPCRCSISFSPPAQTGRPARLMVEVAVHEDALTTSFARVRRNAIISAAASLALLVSVSLIAVRFRPYVRGKQLEAQMDIARQVQADLLPSPATWRPGLDAAAHFAPAAQVGGDFYDILELPDGSVAFDLGDVSGHGVSAALLMSLVHGAMSSSQWGPGDPARSAARLNELLLTRSAGQRYASLFWCSYDPRSGSLKYVNAGHPPPFWIRRSPNGALAIDRLTHGGPVIGLLPDAAFRVQLEDAAAGDILVLFSDGIVEAVNRRDEPFGEDRLLGVARAHADEAARAVCDAIVSAVSDFTEGRPAEDDQTILVVRLWRAGN